MGATLRNAMTRKKPKLQVVARNPKIAKPAKAAAARQSANVESPRPAPPTISGRWLLVAVPTVLVAAALCGWCVLCLLFWQGSWQLLYHPSSKIARTPAAIGLPFSPIGFNTTASGVPRLAGWWIPAAPDARESRYTFLYLHSQDGDLGDTVDHLAELHAAGVNVFALDYRGYGQSEFGHPSEARWLEDAGSALEYLTATRHIDPGTIVLDGSNLGADLALEVAAAHSELAGIVLESPTEDPVSAIFNDARATLLPAHLLVSDRYDLNAPAAALRIPSLWFLPFPKTDVSGPAQNPDVFQKVSARKMFVWLPPGKTQTRNFSDELSRWLDDLQAH
ncbi:MAG: alpha/beta hydrolase [Terracidiphilus sp.]